MTKLPNLASKDQSLVLSIINQHLDILEYEVYVFGSRSKKSKCKPHSDLDLVIKSNNKIPRSLLFKIEEDLELSTLNYRVDIVDWQRTSKEFKQTIQNELIPIPLN